MPLAHLAFHLNVDLWASSRKSLNPNKQPPNTGHPGTMCMRFTDTGNVSWSAGKLCLGQNVVFDWGDATEKPFRCHELPQVWDGHLHCVVLLDCCTFCCIYIFRTVPVWFWILVVIHVCFLDHPKNPSKVTWHKIPTFTAKRWVSLSRLKQAHHKLRKRSHKCNSTNPSMHIYFLVQCVLKIGFS